MVGVYWGLFSLPLQIHNKNYAMHIVLLTSGFSWWNPREEFMGSAGCGERKVQTLGLQIIGIYGKPFFEL